jgi:hypothetical protein
MGMARTQAIPTKAWAGLVVADICPGRDLAVPHAVLGEGLRIGRLEVRDELGPEVGRHATFEVGVGATEAEVSAMRCQ